MTRNKWLASLALTMLCVTALAAPAQAARPPRALPAGTGVASADPNDPKDEQAFFETGLYDLVSLLDRLRFGHAIFHHLDPNHQAPASHITHQLKPFLEFPQVGD